MVIIQFLVSVQIKSEHALYKKLQILWFFIFIKIL